MSSGNQTHKCFYCFTASILVTFLDHYIQGIGNGLPLGAVVTTPEIAQVMAQKIQFNTFGGNPVCSAGGLAVLRVLDKENRQKHCSDVGSHLIGRLKDLQQKFDRNFLLNLTYWNISVLFLLHESLLFIFILFF